MSILSLSFLLVQIHRKVSVIGVKSLIDHWSFKGYAVTGGQDAVINVFNLNAPKDDPDFCLLGHTENICALDVTPGGVIISGSWDR